MIINNGKGTIDFGNHYIAGGHGLRLKHPFRVVQFYYPIKDIAQEIYKQTSAVAKYAKDKSSNSRFDELVLSSDEDEMFNMYVEHAADKVAEILQPFMEMHRRNYMFNKKAKTSGVVDRGEYAKDTNGDLYVALETADIADIADQSKFMKLEEDVTESVHYIIKRDLDVNENMLQLLDRAIKNMIVCSIKAEWFTMTYIEKAPLFVKDEAKAEETLIWELNWDNRRTRVAYPM